MKGELRGHCLCGSVRYVLRPGFRFNPYACHCTDCQTRTGSAFSEHMLFAKPDIQIEGDLDIGSYAQPSGAMSQITGCSKCKTRIFAENDSRPAFASLRCGTLANSANVVPVAHLWVRSKQPWITLPDGVKTMDEQPRTPEEWASFVGIAAP